MKVLLINPMSSRKQPVKGRNTHFPVGLGYIAAYLKQNNFNVSVFDNETECLNKYELTEFIEKSEYDAYGITGMSSQYNYIKGLSSIIKKLKNKPVILGGPLATYSSDVVLENMDIDVCVIGEGEETIIDLLENLDSLGTVAGIAFKQDGVVKYTRTRLPKKDRDEYPFPAYELFNMGRYLGKSQVQYEGWGSQYLNKDTMGIKNIGIVTGIGCPYLCRFCSRSVIKPRLRSIDSIIREIKYCSDEFGVNGVRFLDDLLIINEKRTLELCQKIKPMNMVWSGQARTNLLNEKLSRALKESGCIGLGFGYETGSDRLLTAMKKGTSITKHKEATLAAKNSDLSIRVQIMFGYPGENRESIEETIRFFKDIQIPPRRFNVLTPLPGSEVYEDCLNQGIIVDQDEYLTKVSQMDAGFGKKKMLINLTEMTDKEFEDLLLYAEQKMEDNYKIIFQRTNKLWFLLPVKYNLKKLKHIFKPDAWKRKLNQWFFKDDNGLLSKKEIEDQYFHLDQI
jgi:anaerobic magnesium-protoporphyrin IX monomethyl ester cyclase